MLLTKKKMKEIFLNKDGIKDKKKKQHYVKLLSSGGGQRVSLQHDLDQVSFYAPLSKPFEAIFKVFWRDKFEETGADLQ